MVSSNNEKKTKRQSPLDQKQSRRQNKVLSSR